ncbi:MAG: biotin/lipoyl-containing protein, partial [Acidimicrobiales bacterium]
MSEKTFELPDVGEGLVEAEIVEWKVAVGDVVRLNQPLVDIETAKAVVELPSPYAGVVRARYGEVGDVMAVGSPLVVVDVNVDVDDAPSAAPSGETSDAATSAPGGRTPVLVGYGVEQEDAAPARRRRARPSAHPAPTARVAAPPPPPLAVPAP